MDDKDPSAATSLENLLAVIHRDGGHYTETHGLKKSVADAMTIVANCNVFRDQMKKLTKVCHECGGTKRIVPIVGTWPAVRDIECPTCNGTGRLPVEVGDVEVRLK